MKNVLLTISYDGTAYYGWQKQKDYSTLQETIEDSIYKVTGEKVELIASGRTDAGVHAYGQAANFFTSFDLRCDRYTYALNFHLPEDIRIVESKEVDMDFNSRYMSKTKTYIYQIYNHPIKSPLYDKYSFHISRPLDFELMKYNANMLKGTHDFTSFYTKEADNPKNPVRTIYDISLTKKDDMIVLEITGNGFLYNMVRIIVGTLIQIGLHKKTLTFDEILNYKDRHYCGPTARAKGLFLKNVIY